MKSQSEPRMLVVRSGKELRKVGTREFMEYINELVGEKALILKDRKANLAEERKWVAQQAKDIESRNLVYVMLLDDGKLAGSCEARRGRMKERHNVHFGIAIRKSHRGKGYGEMLLKTCIAEAKARFRPHRMWLEYFEGNDAAAGLYRKLGFVEVARLREYEDHFGEWRDKVLMEYLP